jgi:hypothetical protein
MRVFILCTGRSGSKAFSIACNAIDNYTAEHEGLARRLGKDRFAYPDHHIEADSRLVWFLGALDREFGNEAYYVHLIRDKDKTVRSYNRRWTKNGSIIRAYCEGIHQINMKKLDKNRRIRVVEDFYDNANDNIRHFLKDKDKVLTIHLENIRDDFPRFWEEIGAEGDLQKALDTFETWHNKSKTMRFKKFRHEAKYELMRLRRRIY